MFEKESVPATVTFTIRQLSIITAGFVLLCFFIFIAGYFLGKKRTAEEFYYKTDQESLADQIYSSMCVLYDIKEEDGEAESENSEEIVAENLTDGVSAQQEEKSEIVPTKRYQATIAGFSAAGLSDAKNLIQELTCHGFPAHLLERESKSKGKTVAWYQVVSKPYESQQELEALKPKIAKLAHVSQKSIRIDECR